MRKAKRLRKEIARLGRKLREHQDKCLHSPEHRTYTRGWNTGNYDPTVDCSWITYTCKRCLKLWREDGEQRAIGKEIRK